ncbi:hypothetical protein K439DRAFT_1643685 [Ramaria rubella]|nr:hypothetical protein K439DRAFT_1643685 [Ramaria rubella]
MFAAWDAQAPVLVQTFLEFKYTRSPSMSPVNHEFSVVAVDILERDTQTIPQLPDKLPNCALLCAGLLGTSPTAPSTAISINCLELYHQIRHQQSSFSIQAIAKVLCTLHNVTYTRTFCDQLSSVFDIYLSLLRLVKQHVNKALGRDGPDWQLQYVCPPCGYKLKDEPQIVPACLHAMDGNNSMKCVAGSGHADEQVFLSEYHITPAQVDVFKDDVHKRTPSKASTTEELGALPCKGDTTICAEHWQAANGVSFKNSTQVFDQCGGFISTCRHGIVETLIEMKRSGELAKYGLATLDKLLKVFKEDQCMGYDIGCLFCATVACSSLAERATRYHLLLAVNEFHGHAHNRMRQLHCHPLYLQGLGLKDLETCEHIFSSSNSVVRLIRYSSQFHWMQFLDLHFQQWDEDKYLEISRHVHYNNYKQALAIIKEYTPHVNLLKQTLKLEDSDFECWHAEELQYLHNLEKEPESDVLTVSYVEALQALAERWAALAKLELSMNVVDDLECWLGITTCWTPGDPEYKSAATYIANQQWIHMVEALEGLVVQQLFELAKANLASTGYKLHKHIAKAIICHSAAIKTALEKYNKLAPLQEPAHLPLDYAELASYPLLGEFELLKASHSSLLGKSWAVPTHREVAMMYFKVVQAREEITQLNMESCRLATWVDHKDHLLESVGQSMQHTDPHIAGEIRMLFTRRSQVNDIHRRKLGLLPFRRLHWLMDSRDSS